MNRARCFSKAIHVLAWLLIALTAPGCSTWQAVPLTAQVPVARTIMPAELKLQTSDGRKITLQNWTLEGDTLRGVREAWVAGANVMQPEVLQVGDVVLRDGGLKGDNLQKYLETKEAELAAARDRAMATSGSPQVPSEVRVRLVNGTTIELVNAVVDGDSLRGRSTPTATDRGYRQMSIALEDIAVVEASHFDGGKTAGLGLLVGVVILAAYVVAYGVAMSHSY